MSKLSFINVDVVIIFADSFVGISQRGPDSCDIVHSDLNQSRWLFEKEGEQGNSQTINRHEQWEKRIDHSDD
jgi:hypothetical protein